MLKTAILVLNSKYVHASLAPWYLLAAIKQRNPNAEVKVIESTINRTVEDTYCDIKTYSPDLLACSCYIWNIEKTLSIAKEYKQSNPSATIVLGGPEVSYRGEEILKKYPFVDCIISGEGELPISMLQCRLEKGEDLNEIPGLFYRRNGKIIAAEPYVTDAEPPDPYLPEFFEALGGRICYIEGSRGCPYSCAFCLSGRCGGVRLFGLQRIKDNIVRLGNSGSKTVKFVDRTFNAHKKRAVEIWEFIIENSGVLFPADVCFHFEIAGDLLDSSSLELLKKAPKGIIQLEVGMQSFNEKTLAAVNRKTNTSRLIANLKELSALSNIHLHIDLIAGLPYEDLESFKNSFNIGFSLGADNLQMGFLKLLHGAPMRESPSEYPCEFSKLPPYEVTSTPWLSREEIIKLKFTEDALERLSNSGRFKNTLNYLVSTLHCDPFTLFWNFGNAYTENANISLNDYFQLVYSFFSVYEETDRVLLKDMLVLDKLLSDPSGYLPKALQTPDPRLKMIKAKLNKVYGNKGKKLGIAILYSGQEKILCVDYNKTDGRESKAMFFSFSDVSKM